MSDLQKKLQKIVDENSKRVEETGRAHIDTCDASYYGWDSDVWDHRHTIMNAFRNRGYQVSATTNHGVLDIVITKPIELN